MRDGLSRLRALSSEPPASCNKDVGMLQYKVRNSLGELRLLVKAPPQVAFSKVVDILELVQEQIPGRDSPGLS